MNTVKVTHLGNNRLSAEVVSLIASRPDLELAAIIDPRGDGPGASSQDDSATPHAGIVSHSDGNALGGIPGQIVTHCTDSSLAAAYPEILAAVSSGKSAISSCAELALPWARNAHIAQQIEDEARRTGARVLGIGAITGFPMGILAMAASSGCGLIRSLSLSRRITLRADEPERAQRAGAGLTFEEFKAAAGEGAVGFPGLGESLALAAGSIGWSLDSVEETIEPLLARRKIKSSNGMIAKGAVEGLRQQARGTVRGRLVLSIDIEASVQLENPCDEIVIDGVPPMTLLVPGGIDDLRATAALIVSCIPAVIASRRAGILTLHELPLAPYAAFNAPPTVVASGSGDERLIVGTSAENG